MNSYLIERPPLPESAIYYPNYTKVRLNPLHVIMNTKLKNLFAKLKEDEEKEELNSASQKD